jgi:hypothetical protein
MKFTDWLLLKYGASYIHYLKNIYNNGDLNVVCKESKLYKHYKKELISIRLDGLDKWKKINDDVLEKVKHLKTSWTDMDGIRQYIKK